MYICTDIYREVNDGNESDNMKKIEKHSNPKVMNTAKSTLKHLNSSKPSSGL